MRNYFLIIMILLTVVLVGCSKPEKEAEVYMDVVIVDHHVQVSIVDGKKTTKYFVVVENDNLDKYYKWHVEVELKLSLWETFERQYPKEATIRVNKKDLIQIRN